MSLTGKIGKAREEIENLHQALEAFEGRLRDEARDLEMAARRLPSDMQSMAEPRGFLLGRAQALRDVASKLPSDIPF